MERVAKAVRHGRIYSDVNHARLQYVTTERGGDGNL